MFPFVHLFKSQGNFYVYDVNTNQIVRISSALYGYLKTLGNGEVALKNESLHEELLSLQNKGYLGSHHPKRIIRQDTEDLEYYLNHRMCEMILQVTQSCNFACRYCKYSYDPTGLNHRHNNRFMTWDMAKKCIDFIAARSRDTNFISIAFYGGEPLLNFPLIKKSIEYAENIFQGKKQRYAMTSNGSLLSLEIAEYLMKKNVSLTISLDGPQDIHDKNRKNGKDGQGTFLNVYNNLLKVRETFPDYYQKIKYNSVLDPLNNIRDVNHFFAQDLFKGSFVNTPLVKLNDTERLFFPGVSLEEYNKDKFLALLAMTGVCDPSEITKIARTYYELLIKFKKNLSIGSMLPSEFGVGGTCKLGALRAFVTLDGRIYPCEKIDDESKSMQIGTIDKGFDFSHIKKLYNMFGLLDGKCNYCWNLRLCNICPMRIDAGDSLSKDKLSIECRNEKRNSETMLKALIAVAEAVDSMNC